MHIFLTGPKHVGKTTLLEAILADYSGRIGGFRTVRTAGYLPDGYSVHLLPADGSQKPGVGNLLFCCAAPDPDVLERFDRLGCAALAASADAQLLIMDELGPHETGASAFQAAVWEAVEGNIPILGVLQDAPSPMLERIANHRNTFLLRLTPENRDDLAKRIPEFLNILR